MDSLNLTNLAGHEFTVHLVPTNGVLLGTVQVVIKGESGEHRNVSSSNDDVVRFFERVFNLAIEEGAYERD